MEKTNERLTQSCADDQNGWHASGVHADVWSEGSLDPLGEMAVKETFVTAVAWCLIRYREAWLGVEKHPLTLRSCAWHLDSIFVCASQGAAPAADEAHTLRIDGLSSGRCGWFRTGDAPGS